MFVTEERRVWMRLRDHVVVPERDPDFQRFLTDPSGSVLHILRIWAGLPGSTVHGARHYIGSVRRFACGGWMSRRELFRLFRRATIAARHLEVSAPVFRRRLRRFLREYYRYWPRRRSSYPWEEFL